MAVASTPPHARHDPILAISHPLFRAVLILSPTGNTTRMLSVPELILAATTGNKFVLNSPRSFFSYTEVARTRRRSNLWHLQLANCTWVEKAYCVIYSTLLIDVSTNCTYLRAFVSITISDLVKLIRCLIIIIMDVTTDEYIVMSLFIIINDNILHSLQ